MRWKRPFEKPIDNQKSEELQNQDSVDISTKPEPARRINKLVICAVGLIATIAIGYSLFPGGSSAPKEKPEQEIKTTGAVLTEENFNKAEQANKNKDLKNKNNKNVNAQNMTDSDMQMIAEDKIPPGFEKDEHGNLRKAYSGSSVKSSSGSSSAPGPLTPYQKYKDASQQAYYKRQLAEEDSLYKEEINAKRSEIFFRLDGNKKDTERRKENNSSPETVSNRYYNDGVFSDSKNTEKEFDNDYIQVVGRNK